MSNILRETGLEVHHWTENLFTLKTTRDPGFRFDSGEFAMMGLEVDGRPLLRAYSVVSAPYDEQLQILSIKVPNGPLTRRLQHVKPGRHDPCQPQGHRDPAAPQSGAGQEPVAAVHRHGPRALPVDHQGPDCLRTVRPRHPDPHGSQQENELVCGEKALEDLKQNEYIGELAAEKLIYYPTVTREPFQNEGRVRRPDTQGAGKVFTDLGLEPLNPADDRVIICGNPHMTAELTKYMEDQGFEMGANKTSPAPFVIEKAFAQR